MAKADARRAELRGRRAGRHALRQLVDHDQPRAVRPAADDQHPPRPEAGQRLDARAGRRIAEGGGGRGAGGGAESARQPEPRAAGQRAAGIRAGGSCTRLLCRAARSYSPSSTRSTWRPAILDGRPMPAADTRPGRSILYLIEGPRITEWLAPGVVKQHRDKGNHSQSPHPEWLRPQVSLPAATAASSFFVVAATMASTRPSTGLPFSFATSASDFPPAERAGEARRWSCPGSRRQPRCRRPGRCGDGTPRGGRSPNSGVSGDSIRFFSASPCSFVIVPAATARSMRFRKRRAERVVELARVDTELLGRVVDQRPCCRPAGSRAGSLQSPPRRRRPRSRSRPRSRRGSRVPGRLMSGGESNHASRRQTREHVVPLVRPPGTCRTLWLSATSSGATAGLSETTLWLRATRICSASDARRLAGSCTGGRRSVIRVPPPSARSATTVPPCASATSRTIARASRRRAATAPRSSGRSGRRRREGPSSANPGPWSRTDSSPPGGETSTTPPPAPLRCVLEQVPDCALHPAREPYDDGRLQVASDDVTSGRARRARSTAPRDEHVEANVLRARRAAPRARLDQVGHERGQLVELRRRRRRAGAGARPATARGPAQDLDVRPQARQRRAQLVRRVGDERRWARSSDSSSARRASC